MNENDTGAQFAARQHLQTVKVQETTIHGQQKEIDRLNAKLIEKIDGSTLLQLQLAALEDQLAHLTAPKN